MNNIELAKKLAAQTQLDETQAAVLITAFGETLASYFQKGEKVVMSEFGSFFVREDKTIQFNPSAKLKELVG